MTAFQVNLGFSGSLQPPSRTELYANSAARSDLQGSQ